MKSIMLELIDSEFFKKRPEITVTYHAKNTNVYLHLGGEATLSMSSDSVLKVICDQYFGTREDAQELKITLQRIVSPMFLYMDFFDMHFNI